jgi:hypothetical protein
MKLIIISLISWLSGVAVISASSYFFYGELSSADFMGFAGMSLMGAVIVFAALYLPGLLWLRRRLGGLHPALLFPVTSALVLNLPVFLLLAFAGGRKMAVSEAILFASGFLTMGATFGLGFIWSWKRSANG